MLNNKHGTVMSFDKKRGGFQVLIQLEKGIDSPGGLLTEAITVQSLFKPTNLRSTGAVATVRELQVLISSPKFSKVEELTDATLRQLLAEQAAEVKKVSGGTAFLSDTVDV
mgnify:FL=1